MHRARRAAAVRRLDPARARRCSREVLLAWAMNGEPLPARARRAVAGGRARATSAPAASSGSTRIEVRDRAVDGLLPGRRLPAAAARRRASPGPGEGVPLGVVALNSDVLTPDGASVSRRRDHGSGYAFAGGDGTWRGSRCRSTAGRRGPGRAARRASGRGRGGCGAARVELAPRREVVARAWDSAAALQPERRRARVEPEGLRQQLVGARHARMTSVRSSWLSSGSRAS